MELRDDGRALNLDPWSKWSSQWKLSTSAVSKESLSLRKDRNHLVEDRDIQDPLRDPRHAAFASAGAGVPAAFSRR